MREIIDMGLNNMKNNETKNNGKKSKSTMNVKTAEKVMTGIDFRNTSMHFNRGISIGN